MSDAINFHLSIFPFSNDNIQFAKSLIFTRIIFAKLGAAALFAFQRRTGNGLRG